MIPVSPVVLCGGSGTRLWPLSRAALPKQFLALSGPQTLFQQAVQRVNAIAAAGIAIGQTLVVTHEDHRFLALNQLSSLTLTDVSLLLEPLGRNTAPALTLASLHATANGADPVLLVCAADHAVAEVQAFTAALQAAVRCADSGAIALMAVPPTGPQTGYGYVQRHGEPGHHGECVVKRFVEKPSAEAAQAYVASGDYAWNSGIFVLRASVWLKALGHFRPDILSATRLAWDARACDGPFVRPEGGAFKAVPAESIDYAVMEKCPGSAFPIVAVPLVAGWSDLGAWDAVWQAGAKDAHGNAVQGDTLLSDTSNTLVHATGRLVAAVGVKDLVIVETADAVLVTERRHVQAAGALAAQLGRLGRSEHLVHRKTQRPWGWYDNLDEGAGFKVKRILVAAGAKLSLQRHRHRCEHWIVVKGEAQVTCGDKVFLLRENESTYIPQGATHRLVNLGDSPVEIIEVQTGGYLGEDDIERLEDIYGRAADEPQRQP